MLEFIVLKIIFEKLSHIAKYALISNSLFARYDPFSQIQAQIRNIEHEFFEHFNSKRTVRTLQTTHIYNVIVHDLPRGQKIIIIRRRCG